MPTGFLTHYPTEHAAMPTLVRVFRLEGTVMNYPVMPRVDPWTGRKIDAWEDTREATTRSAAQARAYAEEVEQQIAAKSEPPEPKRQRVTIEEELRSSAFQLVQQVAPPPLVKLRAPRGRPRPLILQSLKHHLHRPTLVT